MQFNIFCMICLMFITSITFAHHTKQYPNHAPFQGLEFQHHDWQVSCDNIGTCRIAGYHTEDSDKNLISVLFTRTMNDHQLSDIQGVLKIEQHYAILPHKLSSLTLYINGQSYGQVIQLKENYYRLKTKQIQALLANSTQKRNIQLMTGKYVWQLSDQGLHAVLLKADEYQKRVNTASAFIKKGNQINPTGQYYLPSIISKPLPKQLNKYQIPSQSKQGQALFKILAKTVETRDILHSHAQIPENLCPDLANTQHISRPYFNVITLSKTQKLVSHPCWNGAYNYGDGVWVMNHNLSQVQQFITVDASDVPNSQYPQNQIMANHKNRGIGDCWNQRTWTWNGERFIQTYENTTGMCRGFLGGAWSFPTYQVDVKHDKSNTQQLSNKGQ